MRSVYPQVYPIAQTQLNWGGMFDYLNEVGGTAWHDRTADQAGQILDEDRRRGREGELLVEFAGKACYRAWEPGLNPNVTKVRNDSEAYLDNVLHSGHGSVLEHTTYSFVFHNVSRVFTHELVRHRAGVAISQESLRYVRLDNLPVWWPDWAQDDAELMKRTEGLVESMEEFQLWAADHFGLDDDRTPFDLKKKKTSFMRRFAPDGVATGLVWTANVRTLRWVLELRTDPSAEEEIRLVFDQVGKHLVKTSPLLFGDFLRSDDGAWKPTNRKV